MATKKIHIPSHHGQMLDLTGSADVAPVEPQTTDMSLNDQQRAAIGAGAGDYQFDLSGAANLSWSDWHSTALPNKKKTAPVIAQVPTVGLYNANPYRSGEDAARQADVLQQQQTDPSMVEAFKTGWRQTMLARTFADPMERPDFPSNLPKMSSDDLRREILALPYEPSPEEQDRLIGAQSRQEFQYYSQKFAKNREDMVQASWSPASMMTGMMMDYDAALAALGGVVGVAAKGSSAILTASKVGEAAKISRFVARAGNMAGGIVNIARGEYTTSRMANMGLNMARSVGVSAVASANADTQVSARDVAQFALMEGVAGFLMKRTPEGHLVPHPELPPTPAEVKAGAHLDPDMPHLPSPAEEARIMQNNTPTAGEVVPGAEKPVAPRPAPAPAADGMVAEPVPVSPGVAALDEGLAAEPAPNGALGRAVERVFGAKDTDTGSSGYFSLYDRMRSYGGTVHKLGQMLVSNPIGNFGQSAAHFARMSYLELSRKLEPLEADLWKATGMGRLERAMNRGVFNERVNKLSQDLLADLRLKGEAHAAGLPLPVNADPVIERIAKSYANSGFATTALKYLKTAERTGADAVAENPYYVPMQFSVDRLLAGIRSGKFTEEDARGLFRLQVQNGMPRWSQEVQQKVADRMYENILKRGEGVATRSNHFEGLPSDALVEAAEQAGVKPEQIQELLGVVAQRRSTGSTEKNLKHRFNWNHAVSYTSEDGRRTVSLSDLEEHDIPKILERYTRNVSGQYGLGMHGFRNNADVRDALSRISEDVLARTGSETHRKAAMNLAENVFNHLSGRATGEPIPPMLRAMNQIAGSMALKNSGIYQIMELANVVHAVGVKETLSAVADAGLHFKTMEALGKDPARMKTLAGILEGNFVAAGRWKPFVTHFEDNVELPGTWLTDAAAQIQESTRFANGLEIMRRKVAQVAAGVACTELEHAVAGEAKSAQLMARYGLDASLLSDVKAQLSAGKSFDRMEEWDAHVNARLQAVMGNVIDNWNSENRLGDIPAFMQFSAIGKGILPYMSFMGGAFNRLGRKHIQDTGSAGLAMAMTSQLTLGALAESLKNLSAGRGPTDSGAGSSYFRKVLENNPAAGWIGFATSLGGSSGNRAPALSVVGNAVKAVQDPSLKNTVATVPLLSIVPGVGAMTSLLSDGDD